MWGNLLLMGGIRLVMFIPFYTNKKEHLTGLTGLTRLINIMDERTGLFMKE